MENSWNVMLVTGIFDKEFCSGNAWGFVWGKFCRVGVIFHGECPSGLDWIGLGKA